MPVLDHLMEEHRKAMAMIEQLSQSQEGPQREATLQELTMALQKHMAVEERFIYPIVQSTLGAEKAQGAEAEHGLARDGLTKMQQLVDQPGFEAAVDMVRAGIEHHVHEEEEQIFPELRSRASEQLDQLDPDQMEQQVQAGSSSTSGSNAPTKQELYDRAREAGVQGRSQMSKDELADAVSKQSR